MKILRCWSIALCCLALEGTMNLQRLILAIPQALGTQSIRAGMWYYSWSNPTIHNKAYHLRRWPNNDQTLGPHPVFSVTVYIGQDTRRWTCWISIEPSLAINRTLHSLFFLSLNNIITFLFKSYLLFAQIFEKFRQKSHNVIIFRINLHLKIGIW